MKFKNGSKIKDIPSKEKIKGFGTKNLFVDVSFEEQFPSWNKFMADIKLRKLDRVKSELGYYKLRCKYQLQAMEKHCIDKQKVKEVIDRRIELSKNMDRPNCYVTLSLEGLRKELGLM